MIMLNNMIPMAFLPGSDVEEKLPDENHWQSKTNERMIWLNQQHKL